MRISLFILFVFCLCRAEAAPVTELHIALWVADASELGRPVSESAQGLGLGAFNEALAREICRRIKARCVMDKALFADILPGIQSKRFDLGFGNFLRTPEREKHVAFSDTIWTSSSRLLVRADLVSRLHARFGQEIGFDKLRDIRVAAVLGSQQHAYLQSIAGEHRLRVRGVQALADALTLLGEDQVDLVFAPMLMAYELLRREDSGRFTFIGSPLVSNGLGGSVHIALAKDRDELRQSVNAAIAGLRADGTYHRLLHRHFPFSLE